ncbi:MAG: hypothetical protein AAF191_21175 [Verrucomicrobiota bacterium]
MAIAHGVDHLWDWEERCYDPGKVRLYLDSAWDSDRIMLEFLLTIWRGDNVRGFDIIDAASGLSVEHRKVIAEWILNPFWP